MKKRGITISSLIVYVILFYLFTTLVVSVSSNINSKTFRDRAKVEMNKESALLMTYVLNSAKNSENVDIIGDSIVFTNNDEYVFKDKKIYKNDKLIMKDVANLKYSISNLTSTKKSLSVTINLERFTEKKEKTYNFVVGGGVYE